MTGPAIGWKNADEDAELIEPAGFVIPVVFKGCAVVYPR
jgi:hypothetical protein